MMATSKPFSRKMPDTTPTLMDLAIPLYPEGDPRAVLSVASKSLMKHLQGWLVKQLSERLSLAPNIDAALAGVCVTLWVP